MSDNACDVRYDVSLFTDYDVYLFREGNHSRLYERMGAHVMDCKGTKGTYFAVWAPNAEGVSVMGDFNGWSKDLHPLSPRWDSSGIWEGFIPGVAQGAHYKYFVRSKLEGYAVDKRDPFAFHGQVAPETSSIVWTLDHEWADSSWMNDRSKRQDLHAPVSIYEVHLGSWRRLPEEDNRFLTYREIAPLLAEHMKQMDFTHVEFLPLTEHPFYGSWGYLVTGYFSPTSRYGDPEGLMYLIDYLHRQGVGVIMDWVPSHFPTDEHGLGYFDGTHLYEHADPRKGFHPDWNSFIFNYGRNEVRNFLNSSANFWLDRYHLDAIRVDAVASMLYLDYSRQEGGWIPNEYGGKENLEALDFIRKMNETVYGLHPGIQTIAEESTAWPQVSRPVYAGGLGFGYKWDMGWMHDTLKYMSRDPIHRRYHHNDLTFRMLYAWHENFILPLSHDEVVHGKGSLIGRMPKDEWQKFANLRLMYGYMYGQSGKKLLFMGAEFGQWNEWYHESSLDWHLLQYDRHRQVMQWVKDLNSFYRREPAMHYLDCDPEGFRWIEPNDYENSVLTFYRTDGEEIIVAAANFTPTPHLNYRVGLPKPGRYEELLNSDAKDYGGSGHGNMGGVKTVPVRYHGHRQSAVFVIPPLGISFFKWKG